MRPLDPDVSPPDSAAHGRPRVALLVGDDLRGVEALLNAVGDRGRVIGAVTLTAAASEWADGRAIPSIGLAPSAFARPEDAGATLAARLSVFGPDVVALAAAAASAGELVRRFGDRVVHPAEPGPWVDAIIDACARVAPERAADPSVVWPITGRDGPRLDYRIFTVERHLARHPQSGAERPFSVLRSADWVNVIALTPDARVVLVRQFRHGTGTVTVEIPGGIVDPGERFVDAAARELREETGYVADRWIDLGAVQPNPAFQDNRCGTVLALDARPLEAPEFDDGEFIAVQTATLDAVRAMIARGAITHALVVAGFFHFVEFAGGWRSPG